MDQSTFGQRLNQELKSEIRLMVQTKLNTDDAMSWFTSLNQQYAIDCLLGNEYSSRSNTNLNAEPGLHTEVHNMDNVSHVLYPLKDLTGTQVVNLCLGPATSTTTYWRRRPSAETDTFRRHYQKYPTKCHSP